MPKRGPRPVPRCWLHFQRRDHPTTKGYKEKRRGEPGDIFAPTSRMRRAVSAARTIALLARHPRHNTSISSPRRRARHSAFECLQVGDDIGYLIWIEAKLRHGGMTRNDPFGQRTFERFDRIFEMQRAERRRNSKRALAHLVDRMTLRAVNAHKCEAALRRRGLLCEGGATGT